MNYYTKLRKIANSYYNRGLERAELKDLSGAVLYLKKALCFNKYCTDARNLLGLIYYATGETADALVQWIISMNLQPENNIADRYLEEIQRKPGQIELASSVVKKFNQALNIAQTGGEDFAIVDLTNIVREYPHYIKAQLLLAILYMQKGENVKAGKALMAVLDIDRNNPRAVVLMDEVKQRTGKAEIENAKLRNAFSHRELLDDDVIIPKSRGQASTRQLILTLAGGVVLGLLSFYLLIMPAVRRSHIAQLNQQTVASSQQMSDLNASYNSLKQEHELLTTDYEDVKRRLDIFEEENAGFTNMYQYLNGIINEYREGDILKAAENYLQIDRSMITMEPLTGILADIDRYMTNEGFARVSQAGTDAWNAGELQTAEKRYDLALKIRGDDPETLYLKARLLQSQDRINEANEIFDVIVGEHPENQYAEKAIAARGY